MASVIPRIHHLDLLRHGETRGGSRFRGRLDDPLTARGWDRMWAAVGPVNGDGEGVREWDGIVTSPLTRCADFARALSERQGIPLRMDPRLAELDFGDWEGRTAAELMVADAEALGRFWADPVAHPPPGGEPLLTFQARVLAAWEELVRQDRGDRTLVVSHGGVMRVILCQVRGYPLGRLLELDVGHASLTGIRVRIGGEGAGACVGVGEAPGILAGAEALREEQGAEKAEVEMDDGTCILAGADTCIEGQGAEAAAAGLGDAKAILAGAEAPSEEQGPEKTEVKMDDGRCILFGADICIEEQGAGEAEARIVDAKGILAGAEAPSEGQVAEAAAGGLGHTKGFLAGGQSPIGPGIRGRIKLIRDPVVS
ncbi:MAG: alpha-ribazole phosphatase family protein [Chromatiaceae bacterium]|nr:alpha-ribazole phosphatase family protein [Chromatiaceae bacterium]